MRSSSARTPPHGPRRRGPASRLPYATRRRGPPHLRTGPSLHPRVTRAAQPVTNSCVTIAAGDFVQVHDAADPDDNARRVPVTTAIVSTPLSMSVMSTIAPTPRPPRPFTSNCSGAWLGSLPSAASPRSCRPSRCARRRHQRSSSAPPGAGFARHRLPHHVLLRCPRHCRRRRQRAPHVCRHRLQCSPPRAADDADRDDAVQRVDDVRDGAAARPLAAIHFEPVRCQLGSSPSATSLSSVPSASLRSSSGIAAQRSRRPVRASPPPASALPRALVSAPLLWLPSVCTTRPPSLLPALPATQSPWRLPSAGSSGVDPPSLEPLVCRS